MNVCATGSASDNEDIKATIIALEKHALELWNNGNPDAYLELYSDDITYFDPSLEFKLEGKKTMEDYYEKARGLVEIDSFEMVNPVVQSTSDCAVLTFNLLSYSKDKVHKWNCTEVYKLDSHGNWKIIHNHWSLTKVL